MAPLMHSRLRTQNRLFLALMLAGLVFALYPGRFDGDSISQVHQGIHFRFGDQWSPQMSLALGILADMASGPGPMFCVQLAVLFIGLYFITDTVAEEGAPVAACVISVLATCPFVAFDYVDVQKDALLTALTVLMFGLVMRWRSRQTPLTIFDFMFVAALFTFALDVRKNAVFLLMLLPLSLMNFARGRCRSIALGIVLCGGCLASAFVVDQFVDYRLLYADREHVVTDLFLFDLAGISARTGADATAGLLPDMMQNVARCYTPRAWDQFRWGACKPVGDAAHRLMADPETASALPGQWRRAILSHPVAYAAHRLAHFTCFMRITCGDQQFVTAGLSYPRPWDAQYPMRISRLGLFLEKIAFFFYGASLVSGWFWLLILSIQLLVSLRLLARNGYSFVPFFTALMSASALAYATGYLIIGISDELRYLQPTYVLAMITLPLFVCLNARRVVAATAATFGRGKDRQRVRSEAPHRAG